MYSNFTVDCLILGFHESQLKVLLTERNNYPFKDWWSIPGQFVENDEEMEDAVKRVLYNNTGLKDVYLSQLKSFAGLKRHPEGRVLTVAYYALVYLDSERLETHPVTSYMKQAKWFPIKEVPELAFDHNMILDICLDKLRHRVSYTSLAFELLPEKFTLTQLQQVYENILNKPLDKRNFRKKMLNYDFLKELDEVQKGVSYRAARLYKLDKKKFQKYLQSEIYF